MSKFWFSSFFYFFCFCLLYSLIKIWFILQLSFLIWLILLFLLTKILPKFSLFNDVKLFWFVKSFPNSLCVPLIFKFGFWEKSLKTFDEFFWLKIFTLLDNGIMLFELHMIHNLIIEMWFPLIYLPIYFLLNILVLFLIIYFDKLIKNFYYNY